MLILGIDKCLLWAQPMPILKSLMCLLSSMTSCLWCFPLFCTMASPSFVQSYASFRIVGCPAQASSPSCSRRAGSCCTTASKARSACARLRGALLCTLARFHACTTARLQHCTPYPRARHSLACMHAYLPCLPVCPHTCPPACPHACARMHTRSPVHRWEPARMHAPTRALTHSCTRAWSYACTHTCTHAD